MTSMLSTRISMTPKRNLKTSTTMEKTLEIRCSACTTRYSASRTSGRVDHIPLKKCDHS